MWRLVFVCLFSWAGGQSGRAPRQDHHGRGWDIRLAVPGQPGNDYPTLGNIPRTTFSCAGKEPGYYADLETNCQAFRVCTSGSTYGFQSFLCPNGTLFNQAVFVCDWWMNVNCGASQKYFNNNNEKFGNLKLGPQLMKDIKKMLTHPMRNPFDKSIMKNNLVVMQDYKPPPGQLFPNSALISNADRTPSNVFVPPKVTQQNFGQTNFIRDTSYAGSTPSPSYIPFDVQPTQADAEIFQRQRQNGQYVQNNRQNSQSGNQFGRLVQPTSSTNNNANNFRQNQFNTAPTTYNPQNFNNQRIQNNGQIAQYTANKAPAQWNNGKQAEFGISLTKQQYNYNTNKANQQQNSAYPKFSSDIRGPVGNEAKQNLALVFSLLANSINAAKEYGNIAQQNVLPAAPTQPQFQNVNEDELARITNQISQLTSSQYSTNNQNGNIGNTNVVSTSQTTTTNSGTQYRQTQFTNNVRNTGQSGQYNAAPQQSGSFYSSQFQFGNDVRPVIANANANQIYSGQLYQLPVPEVTEQIYNQGSPAKIIQANNVSNFATEAEHLHGSDQQSNLNNNNAVKQTSAEVEIVKSHSLPIASPAKLQLAPSEANFNSQENQQAFINNFLNSEGISAQVQDNIIGTIPHPLEKNKLVTYKKDQSYSFYTTLDNNVLNQQQSNARSQSNAGNQQNAKLTQADDFLSTFQFIPSVSYQLEDEKEQEKILNAFNINEFGSPKSDNNNNNEGYILPKPNRRSDVLTSNVDFSVTHPFAKQIILSQRKPNAIYYGPSSYSAPQGSVGFLDTRQRLVQNNNLNGRLEQFDVSNNGNGYPPNSQRQLGYQ